MSRAIRVAFLHRVAATKMLFLRYVSTNLMKVLSRNETSTVRARRVKGWIEGKILCRSILKCAADYKKRTDHTAYTQACKHCI